MAMLCVALLVAPARAGTDDVAGFLERRVQNDAEDFIAWNRLGDLYLQRLRNSGDDAFLARAARAAERSLAAIPAQQNAGGLAIRTRVELASHRFAAARDSARELHAIMPGKGIPLELVGDALLELGDYEAARRSYDEMRHVDGTTVDSATRLARLDVVFGRNDDATAHLTQALALARELEPPAPEIVAWCLVQRGEIAFKRGRWEAAEEDYAAALAAAPDAWTAAEHLAELRGAEGRTDEAITMFQNLIARVPRPDLPHSLGDLYAFVGRTDDAKPWYERALAGYRRSVADGQVQYLHHLVAFYSDSQEDGEQAVEWARKDLELRHSIYAYDALAWALFKKGDVSGAAETITRALATGVRDAHLLYHAGMIRMSADDVSGGKAALQQALAVNPRYRTFHVHR